MSFRVEVEVRDNERAVARIRDWSPKALANVMKALVLSANRLRNVAITQMQVTPRASMIRHSTGGWVKRRVRRQKGIYHVPSAPGRYPAIDNSGLVQSLIYNTNKSKLEVEMGSSIAKVRGVLSGVVGKTKGDPQYPKFLETGTSKMKERPWMRPTLDSEMSWIRRRVEQAIQEAKP